jgi:cysteine desulfurase
MLECLGVEGNFGNPASRSHSYGWFAEEAIEGARLQVAELVNCDPREIIWTSGATESNNLAIKGAASFYQGEGRHIITSSIEHKSVLDSCRWLEKQGYEISYLNPDERGIVDSRQLDATIRSDTVLVSLMHVNNEIGAINDIRSLGAICRAREVVFHVDAAQSAGKLGIDLSTLPVDLMSFSAHKVYGPKGVGALYVRLSPRVHIDAQIHGGGHERGLRSGTLPTHQVVGMGEAFALAGQEMAEEFARIEALRDLFWSGISSLPGVTLNGSLHPRIPHNINVAFAGVTGEALLNGLKDLALSTGSACNSATVEPSYVLTGIGINRSLAESSLRFSLGRFTTRDEILHAVVQIQDVLPKLRLAYNSSH